MPRRLPLHVERNFVRGHTYLSFRKGKGPRIRLPDDPTSEEFRAAYHAALTGEMAPRPKIEPPVARSIGALIVSYKSSAAFTTHLGPTSKKNYTRRLEILRVSHGHRSLEGMTRHGIESVILKPYAESPGAYLDTLKKLRVLIRHAITLGWLKTDPSLGIVRPKMKEIRAWTDAELAAYEARWPIGTPQRTAYAVMLYVGAARVDTHLITWRQFEDGADYARHKTGMPVHINIAAELEEVLAGTPRNHVTVLNTSFGKPFTINGFSQFMRDAISAAGLPLDVKPHGLRKTLGRKLADAGATAHEIMAALGHSTLAEAERYTREANRRRNGEAAIRKLSDHRVTQTVPGRFGEAAKTAGESK